MNSADLYRRWKPLCSTQSRRHSGWRPPYTALQRIALLQTLESFDVRVAGREGAADREEIYSSIATIYARRGVDGLDEFNRMVQTTQGSGAAPNQSLRNILHASPVPATSLLPCCGLIERSSERDLGILPSSCLRPALVLSPSTSNVVRASHAQGRPREIGAVRLHAGPSVMRLRLRAS